MAPPVPYHRAAGFAGCWLAPTDEGVVTMISVAVVGLDPETAISALDGVQLKVGKSSAPVGLFVTAALSATVPENPPDGVIVMVDESPLLEPFASVTAVPAIEYAGAEAVVKL